MFCKFKFVSDVVSSLNNDKKLPKKKKVTRNDVIVFQHQFLEGRLIQKHIL